MNHAIEILKMKYFSKVDFYTLLASFLIFFEEPFSNKEWNDFEKKIKDGKISIENGLFLPLHKKVPGIYNNLTTKKNKQDFEKNVFYFIIQKKRYLEKEFPTIYKEPKTNLVEVSDLKGGHVYFPYEYIRNQFVNKDYINEVTLLEFPKEFRTKIVQNKYIFEYPEKNTFKSLDEILMLIDKETRNLKKMTQYCYICKKKDPKVKSVKNYMMVYFCSLDCMDKWVI